MNSEKCECGHAWDEHAASGCTHEGCECTKGVSLEAPVTEADQYLAGMEVWGDDD